MAPALWSRWTLGSDRRLLGLDEELGKDGGAAPDEIRGSVRARVQDAALAAAGPGTVLSVERESDGVIEVGVERSNGGRVEVALGRNLRTLELEPEHPGDE